MKKYSNKKYFKAIYLTMMLNVLNQSCTAYTPHGMKPDSTKDCVHRISQSNSSQGRVNKKKNLYKSNAMTVKTHHLPMKGAIYLNYIINGNKQFEGRVCATMCGRIQLHDHLRLFDKKENWGIICEVTSKDKYNDFEEMLKDKGVVPMLPQLEAISKEISPEELLKKGVSIYESFPGSERVNQFGAVAIGLKFLKKV